MPSRPAVPPPADPTLLSLIHDIRHVDNKINGLLREDIEQHGRTSLDTRAYRKLQEDQFRALGTYVYEYLKFSRNLENALSHLFTLPEEAQECTSN